MSNGSILTFVDSIAFGQGPYEASPTWTEVTLAVRPGSSFSTGRQNRNGAFESTSATIKLDNKTGAFTPFNPASPYGNLDGAMPFKREVIYDGVTYPYWAGVVSDVESGFEGAARGFANVTLQQRLALPGLQPLDAIAQGQISRSNPDNFWAFDDTEDPLYQTEAKDFRGIPYPALYQAQRGSRGSIDFGVGTSPGPDTGGSRVAFTPYDSYDGFYLTNDREATWSDFREHESYVILNTDGPVLSWNGATYDPNASIVYEIRDIYGSGVKLELDATGHPAAIVRDVFSGDLANVTATDALTPGVDYAVGMTVTNVADVSTLTLWVDGVDSGSQTYAWGSSNVWSVSEVLVGAGDAGLLTYSGTMSDLARWGNATAGDSTRRDFYTRALFGYDEDTSDVRIARILDLAGIPQEWFSSRGTFTRTLATQATDGRNFIDLLKEIEQAEIGRIFGAADGTIGLASSGAYYLPQTSVTLDAGSHFDLSGVFGVDPDNAVNAWQGQRADGALQRYQASQDIIDSRGQKKADGGSDIVLNNDSDVAQIGHWLVNTTAQPELRFPSVVVSLGRIQRDPDLVRAMLLLGEGDQVNLTGLPTGAPASEYVGFVQRITKQEDGNDLKFTILLSQWSEISTFYLDPYPGDSLSVLYPFSDRYAEDVGSITTTGALTDSGTSVTVATADGSPLLTNVAADLPLDLGVGGERVTCTAVSADTSPQVLTISRGNAPTVPRSHDAGATVTVWPTGIYGV